MIDFPLNPAQGQTYLDYVWNGQGWMLKPVVIEGSEAFVLKEGDTMSGDLKIVKVNPTLIVDKTLTTESASITGTLAGVLRWSVVLGDNTPTGNFVIRRYDVSGGLLGPSLTVDRLDGSSKFTGLVSAPVMEINAPVAGALQTFKVANVAVGSITSNGTNTTYNTTSDGRLKEDLKPFEAGDIIDKLQVYDFAWKDSGERMHGVVAQEALEVYPDAVTHTPADWWGVDYSKFVPLLLQEVKALRERVRQLEMRT